jgi:hypothetical protein
MGQIVVKEIPFMLKVGGGWGEVSGVVEIELTKEPKEAYFLIRSAGLEPPPFGRTLVYVDGSAVGEYEKELPISPRKNT